MTISVARPSGSAAFGVDISVTGDMPDELPGSHTRTPTFEVFVDDDPAAAAVVEIWGTVSGQAWTLLCTLSAAGPNGSDSATPKIQVSYNRYKAVVAQVATTVSAWMAV